MSRWRVIPAAKEIVVRERDYTAQFECHNVDTGTAVKIEYTQDIGGPVSDIIGAFMAVAEVMRRAAAAEETNDEDSARMH
jgi:hypothetical protein